MKPERILFIRTDRMGDVLMNLPAIHLLRQAFPKSWLAFLADKSAVPLLQGHPDLDEIAAIDANLLVKSFQQRLKLLIDIRRACFDTIIVSNPHKDFHLFSFLGGALVRVGYGRKGGFWLNKTLKPFAAEDNRHEIDRNLDLVGLVADKTWDGTWYLPVDSQSAQSLGARLAETFSTRLPLVAVHPGTSNPQKRWPAERFAELCRLILKKGFVPFLVGGAEEKPISDAVVQAVGGIVVDWTGKLSLKELVALFHEKSVKALVSVDSGPVHVAWMSGTPVVALYAKDIPGSHPERWGPRDGRSQVIYEKMGQIEAADVMDRLVSVLESSGERERLPTL